MLPSPDILNEFEYGKFVLSNLAAKRAKQLKEGALAMVQVDSTHPLTIALAEIAAGKIKALFGTSEGMVPADALSADDAITDMLPLEGGDIIGLDDDDLTHPVAFFDDHDEDHEDDEDEDEEIVGARPKVPATLADLADSDDDDEAVDEDEDVAADPDSEEDLSLTDLAEQENPDEDEQED